MSDIYVSNSTGSDLNPGTLQKPIKTFVKAMSKKPSNLFLKKGDTWGETMPVISYSMKIDSYGTGNDPIIKPNNTAILVRHNEVIINGLHIIANRNNTSSVGWYGIDINSSNVKITNNKIEGFFTNILVQKPF